MAKKQEQETAADMLRQFDSLKQKHPDAMLLFRNGDFYEMYREDAVKAAAVLTITLTSRVLPGEKDPVKYTLFSLSRLGCISSQTDTLRAEGGHLRPD